MSKTKARRSNARRRADYPRNDEKSKSPKLKSQPRLPTPNNISIKAKNVGQKEVLKTISEYEISIISGCAGVGKTYLAVAYGLQELKNGKYDKLVFTRPCVEAYGEKLGHLPGTFEEKLAPYMIPIMEILKEYVKPDELNQLVAEEKIVTLPLAFQRGVTWKNSYIVFDEAQNAIPAQFKMFLTRIGENSKMVITGDPGQSDRSGTNGLTDAVQRLQGVDNIGIVEVDKKYIVRNKIIDIIDEMYSDV